MLEQDHPNHIQVLLGDLKEEIMEQLAYTRDREAGLLVPIPEGQVP